MELNQYTSDIKSEGQVNRRARRQAGVNDTADITENQLPSWSGGFTEESARQLCESSLNASKLWDICDFAIDTLPIVEQCITAILFSDTDIYVYESVELFKLECKLAVQSDPSIASDLGYSSHFSLVNYLLSLTCPMDCSNQGTCSNDVCTCTSGFYGSDCSKSITIIPILTTISEEVYSVQSINSSFSRDVTLYGENFMNTGSLSCHLERLELIDNTFYSTNITLISAATFLTAGSVVCSVPASTPFTGYTISVSNNGVDASSSLVYIVQDTICFECDPSRNICLLNVRRYI
ncbi:uncharacterized protein LOC128210638 [Mya arenaria]|uniref:uncharacterized protein LOC128210638 n=1 Tax=Mya arenaria TaxID=6604 RepID=UPI0022E6F69B|nr:uncharacterized protein LOC128210638 [Mya arenaria]